MFTVVLYSIFPVEIVVIAVVAAVCALLAGLVVGLVTGFVIGARKYRRAHPSGAKRMNGDNTQSDGMQCGGDNKQRGDNVCAETKLSKDL